MIYDLRKDSTDLVANLKDTRVGLPSGIEMLDRELLGFSPGEYIIIAGRPSMGKSSLARNIALSVGHPSVGGTVLFYSLEMNYTEVAELLLANLAKVDYHAVKRGEITDGIESRLDSASAQLSTYSIIIDDNSYVTTDYIHRFLKKHNETVSCVIIDYIQLMNVAKRGNENRQEQVTEISRGLLAIAKEFNVPVIALSQLNRNLEYRESTRPRLSDLRESGAMEQDANKVLLLHRPSYYNIKINPNAKDTGEAEIIIAKNRCGPVGSIVCGWIAEFMSFETVPGTEEF